MFYNHSYVSTTEDGKLNITTAAEATRWKGFNPYTKKYEYFTKEFRGGMVNTWNKFCFSGACARACVRCLWCG
jgi:beta-glucanase (GH16 family)